jgi:hypothetical protein
LVFDFKAFSADAGKRLRWLFVAILRETLMGHASHSSSSGLQGCGIGSIVGLAGLGAVKLTSPITY